MPLASPHAAATSDRLAALIAKSIADAGGWIPFSRFMDLALYAPGLGYYSAGAMKVGHGPEDGSDFATAPEISPLFARALARPVADALEPGGVIVELGGGSGALASDLLLALEALDRLPSHYAMLEVSADLRERQRARLRDRVPHLLERVGWLEELPDAIDGVVVGNEVLDALPIDCLVKAEGGWLERGVTCVEDRFAFDDRAPDAPLVAALCESIEEADLLPAGYVAEVHRVMTGLVSSLASRMSARSVMFFIDYGFPASEYYHRQRVDGTLMAHYRHRSTPDVLVRPGLQDITAHVNFTAVAQAAEAAGRHIVGFTSQAAFLLDCGILELIPASVDDVAAYARHASALQRLLSQAEMGELFKVIAIAGRERAVRGFGVSDRRHAL